MEGQGLRVEAKEMGSAPQKQIVLIFEDPAHNAGPIAAHVYFIGRAPNAGARFIYAHSDLSINLRGGSEASAKVNVAVFKSDPTKRPPHGFVFIGIGAMEGWIVIAQTNGKTFTVRASSPALLDVGRGKSSDSLDAMIADYQERRETSAVRH